MRVGENDDKTYSFKKDPKKSFSHFAEVVGIDFTKRNIYIDDTITNGVNYHEVSFDDFSNLWLNPEVKANIPENIPQDRKEDVDFWAAVIEP